jgi:alkylation response protein AidB-like acyl-CoA dehydrogenase
VSTAELIKDNTATGPDAVRCARELVPLLAAEAAQGERDRRITGTAFAAMHDAGLLSLCIPREHGGREADWRTNLDVCAELARGDGAAGWVAAILNIADWIGALFPAAVRAEVFSAPQNHCCGVLIPRHGAAVRAPGGFQVADALWPFGSASWHASWCAFNLPVVDDAGTLVDQVLAMVPMGEVEIVDDWHTTAVRGTGSNSLRLRNVFIPEHRTLPVAPLVTGAYAVESMAERGVLYRCALAPTFGFAITGPLLGLAQAAIDAALGRVATRSIAYTVYTSQATATITHLQLGEAQLKVDSARLHLYRAADEVTAWAERREVMPPTDRARAKADFGWATRLCYEAGELVAAACGGSAIAEKDPLQRILRDLRALSTHGYLLPATQIELLGRIMCGQAPQATLL